MHIRRKLQWGAAAVIANGLLALTAMSPRPALASSCSSHDLLHCIDTCEPSVCQPVAGCTLTVLCPNACGFGRQGTLCSYN